jgi:hypothetical protein
MVTAAGQMQLLLLHRALQAQIARLLLLQLLQEPQAYAPVSAAAALQHLLTLVQPLLLLLVEDWLVFG